MSSGDSVQLTGFGSFVVRDRAARTGRNPQTGATIQIKASKANSRQRINSLDFGEMSA